MRRGSKEGKKGNLREHVYCCVAPLKTMRERKREREKESYKWSKHKIERDITNRSHNISFRCVEMESNRLLLCVSPSLDGGNCFITLTSEKGQYRSL